MKKIVISFVAIVFILSLASCSNTTKKPNLYIEKAQLTKQEESIAKLLGSDNEHRIFDFKLDDSVKSVRINTYELKEGSWKQETGFGSQAFLDNKGRLALDFDNLASGIRIGIQSENHNSGTGYSMDVTEDIPGMTRSTTILDDLTEIIYEQETPLVFQISTNKNAISSYGVESFFTPEEYDKYGYEHVYAVTIQFSQKTVEELDVINQQ